SKCSKRCEKRAGGKRCVDVDADSRKMIFTHFWRIMDWKAKRVYVLSHVDKQDVARRTKSNSPGDNKKMYIRVSSKIAHMQRDVPVHARTEQENDLLLARVRSTELAFRQRCQQLTV
ncbi:hypothetical protein MAR_023404, partial [Mya arenaria]